MAHGGILHRIVQMALSALLVAQPWVHAAAPDALAIDPASLVDPTQARAVLEAIASTRQRMAAERPAAQEACRRRVLVNACLAELETSRREAETRLKGLEVRAKTVLRDSRTTKSLQTEAERAEERERSEPERVEREVEGRARREAREARAAEREEGQPAREAERAARGELQAERERAREEERARREQAREQRAREAPARAAAHAQRLEQHETQRSTHRDRMRDRRGPEAEMPVR